MPWDGVGGVIATNAVLSSANAWLEDSAVTAGGDVLVDAQHYAEIDATATSRIEAWDAKSLVVAFNSIGWIPVNIFFSAADMLTSASDYFYDHTSNDHPATLETGDHVRVDSGPHAGDVFEYKGATQTGFVDLSPELQDYDDGALWVNATVTVSAVFDYTSTDTPATLEAGKRVKIPGGTNGLIYKYVGPTVTGPVNLTPGSGQDYTDTDLWVNSTPVFAGQRPSHAQALVVDTPIEAGGNVTVTATSGAQLNAMVGNDNVVEAALDLLFPGAQTTTKTKDAKTGKEKTKVDGYGANGAAGGIVLAQNKVSTFARAAIIFTGPTQGEVTAAGGDVTVLAQDTAGIDAHSSVVQDVVTTNDLSGIVPIIESIIPGDYDFTTASGDVDLHVGARVRLGATYAGGGDGGEVYVYLGAILPTYVVANGVPNVQNVTPGQTVRLPANWLGLGAPGAAYTFVGTAAQGTSVDLSTANYFDTALWELVTSTVDLGSEDYTSASWLKLVGGAANLENLYPGIGNFTNSDARSIGVLIVLNDLRSDVTALISNAVVSAANVSVIAREDAMLLADAQINVSASGGSFYGTGSVLAANGQLVTNVVLAGAGAWLVGSEVTATGSTFDHVSTDTPTELETGDRVEHDGHVFEYLGSTLAGGVDLSAQDYTDETLWQAVPDGVTVEATTTAGIDATVLSATSTGADGFGVTLAFNSIGWKAQNFLFNAVDALLGDPLISGAFGGERPVATIASVLGSTVLTDDDLTVHAENAAQLERDRLERRQLGRLGDVRRDRQERRRHPRQQQGLEPRQGDDRRLQRRGRRRRHGRRLRRRRHLGERQARLVVDHDEQRRRSVLQGQINNFLPADYLSSEGVKTLLFGDHVRLANDFGTPVATTEDLGAQEVQLNTGDAVALHDGYGAARLTTASGIRLLRLGDNVLVEEGYTGGGDWDVVYRYVGPNARLDLGDQDFRDATKWKPLGGSPGSVYRYLGTLETIDINSADFSDAGLWLELGGTPGSVYEWMGPTTSVDLGSPAHAYSDLGWWKPVPITQLIPQGFNFTQSASVGIGGLVVLNDVRSDVEASISSSDVTGATIAVVALEQALIRALADSTVSSSGGSSWNGQGSSLAVNAVITTNRILSGARAFIVDSTIETTEDDLLVDAQNVSQVDATTLAATSSGNQSVGILLAFNTIGWNPTNLLFAAIDALIGDPLISTAFNGENPAETLAYVKNTSLTIAGSLSVSALNAAQINALVSNTATSAPAAIFGAGGMSASFILASNKVSSVAKAYVEDGVGTVVVRQRPLGLGHERRLDRRRYEDVRGGVADERRRRRDPQHLRRPDRRRVPVHEQLRRPERSLRRQGARGRRRRRGRRREALPVDGLGGARRRPRPRRRGLHATSSSGRSSRRRTSSPTPCRYAVLGEIGTRLGRQATGSSTSYFGLDRLQRRAQHRRGLPRRCRRRGGIGLGDRGRRGMDLASDESMVVPWDGFGALIVTNVVLAGTRCLDRRQRDHDDRRGRRRRCAEPRARSTRPRRRRSRPGRRSAPWSCSTRSAGSRRTCSSTPSTRCSATRSSPRLSTASSPRTRRRPSATRRCRRRAGLRFGDLGRAAERSRRQRERRRGRRRPALHEGRTEGRREVHRQVEEARRLRGERLGRAAASSPRTRSPASPRRRSSSLQPEAR